MYFSRTDLEGNACVILFNSIREGCALLRGMMGRGGRALAEGPGRHCDPGLSREGKVSLPRGHWELRHLSAHLGLFGV